MRYFFLILMLIVINNLNGQILIKGQVMNQANESLPFSTVKILSSKDSSLIGVTSTDSVGRYSFNNVNVNIFLISASFIGFRDTTILVNSDDAISKTVTKNLILNSNNKNLKEVEIISKSNVFQKKIDRFVFNLENNSLSAGNTAFDMLSKTPLVQVMGNSIVIIGKGNANVLLNDKYLYLSGGDLTNLLKSIPADDLVRIEVITNPSSKYEASGGALINIVTKKSILPGTNGSLWSTYSQAFYPTGQFGLVLNHRKRKLNLFGNISYSDGNTHPTEKTYINYSDRKFDQNEYSKLNNKSIYGRLGIDYNLNSRSGISAIYNSSTIFTESINYSIANFMKLSNEIDSTMYINTNSEKFSSSNGVNLDYYYNIDTTGKKITIDADYLQFYNSRDRKLFSTTINDLGTGETNINNSALSNQLINIATLKTDVEWPNKVIKVDYGVKFNWINNKSINSIFNNTNVNSILDTNQSNNFLYTESTQAAYVSLNCKTSV